MARMAHDKGALFMVDGCQAAPHMAVDVQELDVDFYCFSGHKTYGPTGIGALWGRKALLDAMPPYQGGGEMIAHVTFEKSTFKAAPHKFEAGTPAIVEAVGLGAALDYIEAIGRDAILAHESDVAEYARERLSAVPGVHIVGHARERGAIVSFTMEQAPSPRYSRPAPASTGRAWRCAPAITAPFRSWSVSMSARRPGPPSGSTT